MPGHALPETAIARLTAHSTLERELREMRVLTGAPGRFLPPLFRAGAMTFGRYVLFGAGRYDPTSVGGLALIGHEAGHITQWWELGIPRFLVRYGWGVLRSGFAHSRHPLERPLNELQQALRDALEADAH